MVSIMKQQFLPTSGIRTKLSELFKINSSWLKNRAKKSGFFSILTLIDSIFWIGFLGWCANIPLATKTFLFLIFGSLLGDLGTLPKMLITLVTNRCCSGSGSCDVGGVMGSMLSVFRSWLASPGSGLSTTSSNWTLVIGRLFNIIGVVISSVLGSAWSHPIAFGLILMSLLRTLLAVANAVSWVFNNNKSDII